MRKIFFILFLLLPSVFHVWAQQISMRDVLRQMPDSIIPYLTTNSRLDFIDFIDSNMEAEVTNTLGGKSRLQKLTDHYAFLQLSQSSSLSMRLLSVEAPVDSAHQIICMVRNYGQDFHESTVHFYSLKWKKLDPSRYLQLPSNFKVFEASLGETDDVLTMKPVDYMDFPASEEQENITFSLVRFNWKGKYVK